MPASDQTREGGARAPPGNQAIIPRCDAPAGAINRDAEATPTSASMERGEAGVGAEQRMQQAVRSCSVGATGAEPSGFDVQIAPAMVAS